MQWTVAGKAWPTARITTPPHTTVPPGQVLSENLQEYLAHKKQRPPLRPP